jgi:hypothetical protein
MEDAPPITIEHIVRAGICHEMSTVVENLNGVKLDKMPKFPCLFKTLIGRKVGSSQIFDREPTADTYSRLPVQVGPGPGGMTST